MAEEGKKQPLQRIDIKINDETHRGVYANKLIVAHSRDEFILDFVADLPPGPQIVARVITTPGHLRAFLETLRENLSRWERKSGGPPGMVPRADA